MAIMIFPCIIMSMGKMQKNKYLFKPPGPSPIASRDEISRSGEPLTSAKLVPSKCIIPYLPMGHP